MKKKDGVMKAPQFDTVLHSRYDVDARSVSVTFAAVDRTKFELDFSAKCVPLAIAALTLELFRLGGKMPRDGSIEVQGVRITATDLALNDDGTVALLLTLAGGAQLPLQIDRADLVKLRRQIDEAVKLVGPPTRH